MGNKDTARGRADQFCFCQLKHCPIFIMSCPPFDFSTSFNIILTTVCCISGFLAIIENTLVLLTVPKIHSLRTTARYFMTSLAAAELLSGAMGNAFFSSWLMLNHLKHETKSVFWKIETSVWLFTNISITYNLVNVALDRFIAIHSPLQYYTRMSLTRCILLIVFAWISAFCCSALVYLVPIKALPKIWICATIVTILIPFWIIAYCYFKIYRATKSTFRVQQNITDAQQIAEKKRQRKTACTFAIITGIFIVVFTPSFIHTCRHLSKTELYNGEWNEQILCKQYGREAWISIAAISYFSAVFDPWVYLIRMPDFRAASKTLLQQLLQICCKCKLQKQESASRRVGDINVRKGTYLQGKRHFDDTHL